VRSVQLNAPGGPTTALKILERDGSGWLLRSANPDTEPIEGTADMTIIAKLVRRLDQADINPLADKIGDVYKRSDVAALYGQEFNPGNWNSGHVSIPGHAILFVTLEKSDQMSHGADYVDHFEGPDTFIWSSQNSVGPDSKKGREILDSLSTGTQVHLWVRQKKTDVAFEYRGVIAPPVHRPPVLSIEPAYTGTTSPADARAITHIDAPTTRRKTLRETTHPGGAS